MIFSHSKQIIFLRVPKTGSGTVANLFWRYLNLHDAEPVHMTFKEAVQLYPRLATYKPYGFFRNPTDRILSAFNFVKQNTYTKAVLAKKLDIPVEATSELTCAQMIDKFDLLKETYPEFFALQVSWLYDAEVLDFDNYEEEVKKFLRLFDVVIDMLPQKNKSLDPLEPSSNLVDFVRDKYKEDFDFGKSKLGKTY